MSAFWRLAFTLAFVHLIVTMSVWFAVVAKVFGRRFGEFAAALKHRPPPPHEPTAAEAVMSILVQPIAYVLHELQINPLPAYLAINSLFWGIVLAVLIGLVRLCWRWLARPPREKPAAEDQPANEKAC